MFLKNIVDIKITDYGISVTRDTLLSAEKIEEQVKIIEYNGQGKPQNFESEKAKLPPFIQVFYYLFFRHLKIPSEKLFYDTYVEWLGGIIDGNIIVENQKFNAEGIKYRLIRAYPSLIRDLHFLYLLQESKRFESVEYSLRLDYYNGLDIKLNYLGKEIYVSLFIDTTRSVYYKRVKTTKRHDYSAVIEITFNVDFDSLTKFGNIYLLNNAHVDLLEERLIYSISNL